MKRWRQMNHEKRMLLLAMVGAILSLAGDTDLLFIGWSVQIAGWAIADAIVYSRPTYEEEALPTEMCPGCGSPFSGGHFGTCPIATGRER